MSLLPPEKWRFVGRFRLSSTENIKANCNTTPESLQSSSTKSQNTFVSDSSPQTSSTSPSTTSTTPSIPRINKNHGFLKHIIKNQIERDEYEKAITQIRTERNQSRTSSIDQTVSPNYNYISPPMRYSTSSPDSNQLSPQFTFNQNDIQNDPHGELRARARKSLQREGIL